MSLDEKLALLPDKPGVYLMRDAGGHVIYVGKASSLKQRVRSYFHASAQQGAKVRALVQHIADLDYLVTDNEVEALILECNLIKRHRPRYNVNLKDDKHYPYLKVTMEEEWPTLVLTRKMRRDGGRYFGPFTRAGAVHETLRLLRRLFPLRNCKLTVFRQQRPCLNAHIKRCLAPCTGQLPREEYMAVVQQVLLFLGGKQDALVNQMERQMQAAASSLQFEQAAGLRDQLRAIREVMARQKIISAGMEDRDVLALAREDTVACGQVLIIRGGKLQGSEAFQLDGTDVMLDGEVMAGFIQQYYSRVDSIPPEILLQHPPEDQDVIMTWLRQLRGKKVTLKVPRRGSNQELVAMAAANALMLLQQTRFERERHQAMTEGAMLELQQLLNLAVLPRRMECYDISNWQSTALVGAMVVFENGRAKPSAYRRFRIQGLEGPDDYTSLQQVLQRRFRHTRESHDEGFGMLPDLVVVDGGRGQLAVALRVMAELGVGAIPACGLAKEEEAIYLPAAQRPLLLPRDSLALMLLQRLRDETHRFAVTYHRQVRQRAVSASILDAAPGIGPRRKRALLQHFGSVQAMQAAGPEALAAVPGMNGQVAREVWEYLQENQS